MLGDGEGVGGGGPTFDPYASSMQRLICLSSDKPVAAAAMLSNQLH